MAHKLRVDHHRRLRDLLDGSGKTYVVRASAAIHEGMPVGETFAAAEAELKAIFADRLFFLGFASDAMLADVLSSCTFFAAFFPQAHGPTAPASAWRCNAAPSC